jgi:hypothetical protein
MKEPYKKKLVQFIENEKKRRSRAKSIAPDNPKPRNEVVLEFNVTEALR